jgi:NADH-quinone oxidoreductase subunit G
MSDTSAISPPPVETVNVQVDGVWIKVPKGTRIIEACHTASVDVPHYCYHPKLTSPGNCRMCLVEMGMPPRPAPGQEPELGDDGFQKIQWMPRPVIACANSVSENMGIRTQSELVKECRHGVMEFLLANHPLDCPICDQAGECDLQEYSVQHGNAESRFREIKVKKPKNVDIGPRVRLDDERCVMCSRCIRFCDEIVDDPVLGFTERGSHTTLAVHPGQRLENNYSLNTVDICPVGALTSNDFRFQMRVWFLKETNSVCTKCARGCNMVIGSREGTLYRQTPRENNEVNSTWMCDEGRLDFHYVNSDYRLTEPLIRSGKGHRSASWQEVVRMSASVLANFAAADLAIVASARMTNEELFLVRLLSEQLGVSVATIPRTGGGDGFLRHDDLNPNSRGARLVLGYDSHQAWEEVKAALVGGRTKGLLVFGENLLKEGVPADVLSQLDWMLSSHLLANPTAELSHVVIPSAAPAERSGTMINATGRLQRLNPAFMPPGQARPLWEFLRDLLLELGGTGPSTFSGILPGMGEKIPEFAGMTFAKVGDMGVPFLETEETVPLLEREKSRIAKGIIVG